MISQPGEPPHTIRIEDITSPLVTEHGEIIYELVGRTNGETTDRRSIVHATIPPGKSSLLHYHPEAEESYCILKGRARLPIGDEEAIVEPGQTVLIQPPMPHKIFKIGEEDLEFLTICVPAWEQGNSVWLETFTDNE